MAVLDPSPWPTGDRPFQGAASTAALQEWYSRTAERYDRYPERWDKSLDKHVSVVLASASAATTVLDVACGTGIYLVLLEQALTSGRVPSVGSPRLIGLDLSLPMLQRGGQKSSLAQWVQGSALDLPFSSGTIDLVTVQSALHLFGHIPGFAREAHRALRSPGRLSILTYDPWRMTKHWIYRVFPGAREFDFARFPAIDSLSETLKEVGFGVLDVSSREVQRPVTVSMALDLARDRWSTSQFIALSDEDWRAGVHRLEEAASETTDNADLWWHECEVVVTADKG